MSWFVGNEYSQTLDGYLAPCVKIRSHTFWHWPLTGHYFGIDSPDLLESDDFKSRLLKNMKYNNQRSLAASISNRLNQVKYVTNCTYKPLPHNSRFRSTSSLSYLVIYDHLTSERTL